MKIGAIEIPDTLVDSLRDRTLVVFAGAGARIAAKSLACG